jgi:peptide/nickel transport system substrate-binding protein
MIIQIAVLAALFSCGTFAAEVKEPDTYTYAAILEPNSLDPAWAYDSASASVIRNMYEPLFMPDGLSLEKLLPLIATRVPTTANGLVSADRLTYRIPIRKGVKFHDGTVLVPEDVRYSLLRFMLFDRAGGPSSLLLEPLVGYSSTRDDKNQPRPEAYKDVAKAVQIEGDNLVIHLPKPFAPLLSILAAWAPVISKEWVVKNGGWDGSEATWIKFSNPDKEGSLFFQQANGTGPFRLERWDRRLKQLILARHDGYWGKPASLKRVVVRTIPEFATRKLMLQAGDADAIAADRSNLSQLQDMPGVKVFDDLPTMGLDPLVFFTFHVNPVGNSFIGSGKLDGEGIPVDFFNDKDVRKAFAYAFDYQGMIRDVQRGKGSQPTGCIPHGLLGHDDKRKSYAFDMAKAKEYFQKAQGGKVWANGFHFTLAYNSGNNTRAVICQMLKRNIESLNPKFRLETRALEWPSYIEASRSSKVPVVVSAWSADYPDPHNFASPLMRSGGGYPQTQKYVNPSADALVDEALRETNPQRRKALYGKLQDIEFDDVPHLLVLEPAAFRVQREWVKGWKPNHISTEMSYGGFFYPLSKSSP